MNLERLRNLSDEEMILAKTLGIISTYRIPDSFKVIRVNIHFKCCNKDFVNYVKMAEYSDGSWIKDSIIEKEDVSEKWVVEEMNTTVQYCSKCINFIHGCDSNIISKEYFVDMVAKEYSYLKLNRIKYSMNKKVLYETIKLSAVKAATLCGDISDWKYFMPYGVSKIDKEVK